MAIVRTTPKETTTGGTVPPTDTPGAGTPGGKASGAAPASAARVDRTKSVINPSGRAIATGKASPRAAGRAMPQGGQAIARGNSGSFINDTIAELKRVVWPDTNEVRSGTIVTIGLLIFFGLYISGLDIAAKWLFQTLGLYPISIK
jgi:preprotein translocase SecE subunit